jgi:hypothetical protein
MSATIRPLVAGAIALLATACGSSLGYQTPCPVWVSMDSSDQQSTVIAVFQQEGQSNPSSSDVSEFERLASDYCSDPYVNDDTIGGMRDSRAS